MGGLKESKQDRITIDDVQYTTFMAIMEFLYTNDIKLNEILASSIEELIALSNKCICNNSIRLLMQICLRN